RVGARVAGYARPIRDDVMDAQPHGTIDMHRALVASCNAYFAQLAVRLGPRALIEAAAPTGISLARDNDVRRVRDTLPQIGYGQGDLVVSPLTLARVAGAIATDGQMRDARLDPSVAVAGHPIVPPATATVLARFMRDVVL